MAHLNKLNTSINSKRLAATKASTKFVFNDDVAPNAYVAMQLTSFTRKCPFYQWAEHGDLFTLQIITGRAPLIRAELPTLGGPGLHEI